LDGRRGECRAGGCRLREFDADVVAVPAAVDAIGQQRAVRIVRKPGVGVLRQPELRLTWQRVGRTAGWIGLDGRAILNRWNRRLQPVHRGRCRDRIVGSGWR
jgi:hypothetical protein